MYETWANMENNENEWTAGFTAAEAGIHAVNQTRELYYLAGYAHSRHGQYLNHSFHTGKAKDELLKADELLRKALKDPEYLVDYSERRLNSRIFRALAINCAELGRLDDMHHYLDDMHYYIERWQREHPNDEQAMNEGERLKATHPRYS